MNTKTSHINHLIIFISILIFSLNNLYSQRIRKPFIDIFYEIEDSSLRVKKHRKTALNIYKWIQKENKKKNIDYNKLNDYYSKAGASFFYSNDFDGTISNFINAIKLNDTLNNKYNLAYFHNKLALTYEASEEIDSAISHLKIALDILDNLPEKKHNQISIINNDIGYLEYLKGNYDNAIDYYLKALKINRELKNKESISINLNNIGKALEKKKKYKLAIEHYQQALEIDEKLNDKESISYRKQNIGRVYQELDDYESAVESISEAIKLEKRAGNKGKMTDKIYDLGKAYFEWKNYDKALFYFEQALEIAKSSENKIIESTILNNIGFIYYKQKNYNKALDYYDLAMQINKDIKNREHYAINLNNIGKVYMETGKYKKALVNYELALDIDHKTKNKVKESYRLKNIGDLYFNAELYDEALESYRQALDIDLKLEDKNETAMDLNKIGECYYMQRNYEKAINTFKNALPFLDQLISFTEYEKDINLYKNNRSDIYQNLIATYMQIGEFSESFKIIEQSRSEDLIKTMIELGYDNIQLTIDDIQNILDDSTAILVNATVDHPYIIQLLIGKTDRSIKKKKKQFLVDTAMIYFRRDIKQMLYNRFENEYSSIKSLKEETKKLLIEKDVSENLYKFSSVIEYYEYLLKSDSLETREIRKRNLMSAILYDFFIKDFEEILSTKNQIVILPDGILSRIPFESLKNKDGRYLIEDYDISYTQSVSMLMMLSKRKMNPMRKPLIMIQTANDSLNSGDKALKLAEQLPQSYAVSKTSLEASDIKNLSTRGILKRYKIVEFFMNSTINPGNSDSTYLNYNINNTDSTYLFPNEIRSLDLEANYVCLNLNNLRYNDEIKGNHLDLILNPFIIAGTNSVFLSLWNVNSTESINFLNEVYTILKEKELSYFDAVNSVKRQYISGKFGKKYTDPYYWSNSIFYGLPDKDKLLPDF